MLILVYVGLLAVTVPGLWSGWQELREARTRWETAASISEVGYGVFGAVAIAGLWLRKNWSQIAVAAAGLCATFAAAVTPTIYGDAPWQTGIVSGLAAAGLMLLILWGVRKVLSAKTPSL